MRNNIIYTSNGVIGTIFPKEWIEKKIEGKRVLIIDNATYHTGNYETRDTNKKKFLEYRASFVDILTIDDKNVKRILDYDVCYVMGGSIANLVELVQSTDIKAVLKTFLKRGTYIGESSGSIILGKDVKWYFDLKRGTKPKYDRNFESYLGLGFIEECVYPHYNREDSMGINKIDEYPENIIKLIDGEYIIYSLKDRN